MQTLLHKAKKQDNEPLNILSWPTHERYQSNLAKTGHNFYLWQGMGIKPWKEEYAPVPENHILLNPSKLDRQIPPYVDIDLVLSQNKFGQYQIAVEVAKQLDCPMISLEHTLPMREWTKAQLVQMRYMKGKINLFISEYSRGMWGWSEREAEIIHHGIDTELFKPGLPKEPRVLSVVNDWVNRDWCCGFSIWQAMTGYPNSTLPLQVIGDTPGLSKPAESIEHLVSEYSRSLIFVNTSTVSPIPTSLLEAMSCECAVVTTNNCMIPEIITHGENGLMTNDPREMRECVDFLLTHPEEAARLGKNARETVVTRFSLDAFVNGWNDIFRRAVA